MAAAPVKPQPLHNFPLSLKWGQTAALSAPSNHHHHRSSNSSLPTSALAPDTETESDPEQTTIRHPHRVGSRSARAHRFSFTSCTPLLPKPKNSSTENQQKQTTCLETEVAEKPQKQVTVLENCNGADAEEDEEEDKHKQEEEEGNSRPWKLRPRRGILAAKSRGELKEAVMVHVNEKKEREDTPQFQPKSMRLRGLVESTGGGAGTCLEKKEKRKFWIALSREEIEEDIFALTGSRPARRPRKRPKNVQKVLDNVFPGLWLVGTTADSYRVADPPVKR
ncbi:uncharacterized protein LOC110609987 [Manihot esculenta]|uniref:DUF1639 family protein n=3 Tax=Manihot esculenta TaxID=3983 RepID=A0A251LFD0_MANES|nr:uncharacterized protein LOC110609987 [Manihot esculenta]KAG8659485.1 hypothetical protein MANES_02G041700v8 [Manihot esculenta]KAG8659486.1 hypothetical protein MANES_02G041700v8 [Manihot esculenta]OAY56750.1 hypothetical protein MANES_02G041700v8 [Manihot esculenta]OAY56751.1 hypothetical protein MANES_02G041700v8 [Manihot esculenta]